jgi:hypothetical protein
MLKIGIITYHFVQNYGGFMQAWALQEFLKKQGFKAEIIDYRPNHLEAGGDLFWPKSTQELKVILFKIAIKLRNFMASFSKLHKEKKRKFEACHSEDFQLTSKIFRSIRDLDQISETYDIYICGSDQIWNSSIQHGIDEAYFLSFVSANKRRISYAASFGKSYIQEEYKYRIKELLDKFSSISVRESSGTNIVQDIANKDAQCVLDPTLLLDGDYPKAVLPNINSDFLFSYTLRSEELAQKVSNYVSKHLQLSIRSINAIEKNGECLSPWEWLGHFKSAKFIITNSYHGTLFSIIFKKPFIFVSLQGNKAAFNERSISVLRLLGLENRILENSNTDCINKILSTKVDFNKLNFELAGLRENSKNFLLDGINH